jgi:hemerythrin
MLAAKTAANRQEEDFFKWDEQKFGIGVHAMDLEHQKLISLMNQLHSLSKSKAPKPRLVMVLDQLSAYTVKHFEDEERFMQSIAFPGFITHQQVHKSLLEKFEKHAQTFKEGSEPVVPNEFFTFLKVWLQAHIMGLDRKYSEHAK